MRLCARQEQPNYVKRDSIRCLAGDISATVGATQISLDRDRKIASSRQSDRGDSIGISHLAIVLSYREIEKISRDTEIARLRA